MQIPFWVWEVLVNYNSKNVIVAYDDQLNRNYAVIDGDKRLYGWQGASDEDMQFIVSNIQMEQDVESPHQYFSDNFMVNEGVFCDIGSAEGLIALEKIDKVEKAYLFECDKKWVDALKHTFSPYQNKVMIVDKFVSNTNDEQKNTITLDSVLSEEDMGKKIFVKIDVEGAEVKALHGMENILKKCEDISVSVAVYHTTDGAYLCKEYLENLGFECEFSNNYMLFYYDKIGKLKKPYFRHGVLRAQKRSSGVK